MHCVIKALNILIPPWTLYQLTYIYGCYIILWYQHIYVSGTILYILHACRLSTFSLRSILTSLKKSSSREELKPFIVAWAYTWDYVGVCFPGILSPYTNAPSLHICVPFGHKQLLKKFNWKSLQFFRQVLFAHLDKATIKPLCCEVSHQKLLFPRRCGWLHQTD